MDPHESSIFNIVSRVDRSHFGACPFVSLAIQKPHQSGSQSQYISSQNQRYASTDIRFGYTAESEWGLIPTRGTWNKSINDATLKILSDDDEGLNLYDRILSNQHLVSFVLTHSFRSRAASCCIESRLLFKSSHRSQLFVLGSSMPLPPRRAIVDVCNRRPTSGVFAGHYPE